MLRVFRSVLTLLVCVLVAATAYAGGQNDAGTGGDAEGKMGDASRVRTGFGAYSGYLGETDTDWFRWDDDFASPVCVATPVSGAPTAEATLHLRSADAIRRVTQPWGAGYAATVALAAPSVDTTWLGLVNVAPTDAGSYQLNLSALQLHDVMRDAGTTGSVTDAPPLRLNAPTVGAGCFGGSLAGGMSGDTVDTYRFSASVGDVVVLSLVHSTAASPIKLELRDASGSTLADIRSGEVAASTLSSDGVYYLVASLASSAPAPTQVTVSGSTASGALAATEDTSYLVGFVLGPPGGGPCRPTCIELL